MPWGSRTADGWTRIHTKAESSAWGSAWEKREGWRDILGASKYEKDGKGYKAVRLDPFEIITVGDGKEGAVKGERFQVLRSEELAYCEVMIW
jgi:hypothetical protein